MRVLANRGDAQMRLRLPQELKDALKKYAVSNGRSLNAEILVRLGESLKNQVTKL